MATRKTSKPSGRKPRSNPRPSRPKPKVERRDPQRQAPRVLASNDPTPKLHKVLAQSGMGSRLDMERLIAEGQVSVNGKAAHVGQRVAPADIIKVAGRVVRHQVHETRARVLAYHKPAGEVVSRADPQNRPTVFRNLPRVGGGKWQAVGRLDINTEGLLLLTNSGHLANQLMHPRFGLEREYSARVLGKLTPEAKQRLLDGVQLPDGAAQFLRMSDGGGEGANVWYRVTIAEGRHREVRRMFEAVGHVVSRLIRVRYGNVLLPRGLRRGASVELAPRDVRALAQLAQAALDSMGALNDHDETAATPVATARNLGADAVRQRQKAQRRSRQLR
jgi:23S rRNA pseudouridine2605 synthase